MSCRTTSFSPRKTVQSKLSDPNCFLAEHAVPELRALALLSLQRNGICKGVDDPAVTASKLWQERMEEEGGGAAQ